jgi:hypothetical protein
MGCFWKSAFKAIGNFFRENWRSLAQIAAIVVICGTQFNPICVGIVTGIIVGVTSGNLGQAIRSGLIAAVTAAAFYQVGELTTGLQGAPNGGHAALDFMSEAHVFNMAGHALVGCGSAVASGGKCGPGALSAGAGSFVGPLMKGWGFTGKLVATSVIGGVASVAGGGKFGNGAMTAAFGYLFNEFGDAAQRGYEPTFYPAGWFSPATMCNGPDGPGCVTVGARALSLLDDPLLMIFGAAPLKGAISAGETILLGLRSYGVEALGQSIGARTLLSDPHWKTTFMEALGNPSIRFTVSLDGFAGVTVEEQVMNAVARGFGHMPAATQWEMAQLWQAGRLPTTTLMKGGKVVPNPF